MDKHSVGPWTMRGSYTGSTVIHIEDANGQHLAAVRKEMDADLIAAAPELLAALRVIVGNGGIGPESMFREARAAIAKATGKTP